MAKTRRTEEWATTGAVNQHGGSLRVYICNSCGDEVVWVESKRTGRHYLCNVRRGYHSQRFYIGSDIHPRDCREQQQARIAEMLEFEARNR